MVLPTVRVGIPASVNQSRNALTDVPRGTSPSDSRSYSVDRVSHRGDAVQLQSHSLTGLGSPFRPKELGLEYGQV